MVKKKVGNACRTKNQIRNSKAKGSAFEYDCQASLEQCFKSVIRTSERGYQRQYDLHCVDDDGVRVVECKRLKGVSWMQLVNFYEKLKKVTPNVMQRYILFKSNRQPCLVFMRDYFGYKIVEFSTVFNVCFIKHESTRVKK